MREWELGLDVRSLDSQALAFSTTDSEGLWGVNDTLESLLNSVEPYLLEKSRNTHNAKCNFRDLWIPYSHLWTLALGHTLKITKPQNLYT